MKIDHIAIWTKDLEKTKDFYLKYFDCISNSKYINNGKKFTSYFLTFKDGGRLELMNMPGIPDNKNSSLAQYTGIIHIAVSAGSKQKVDEITSRIKSGGYTVISEPRNTGDGYYESCILDPEGNRIEIIS